MNIRDLEYFIAVAEHKHISKAAAWCNVSQPALSMQLKKLEETLNIKLFERSGRTVMITDAGTHMLAHARTIIAAVHQMRESATSLNDPYSGQLRIGLFPTLAPYLLPHIIAPIAEALPKLRLLLVEEKSDVLLEQLHQGTLDAACLALPIPEQSKLTHSFLFDDPFLLATPSNHPLAQSSHIHLSDIRDEPVLLLEEGHCLRAQALEICQMQYVQQNHHTQDFRATSLETLRHMVAGGVGITLMPRLAITPPAQNSRVLYIPFAPPIPKRHIALFWRTQSPRQICMQHIAEIIRTQIDGLYRYSVF